MASAVFPAASFPEAVSILGTRLSICLAVRPEFTVAFLNSVSCLGTLCGCRGEASSGTIEVSGARDCLRLERANDRRRRRIPLRR